MAARPMASPSLGPPPSNYSTPRYGAVASPPSPNMNSAPRYGAVAPNLSLPYDPFSDESIQKSIDSMKKDADTLKTYAIRRGGVPKSLYGDETQFSISTLPLNIKLLLDKYQSSYGELGLLYSLSKEVIEPRIRKLENYLEKSENGRKKFYPMRSYPNDELNIGNVPRSPQPMPMAALGGARRRRTRRHKKSHKKTRRVRNNRR